MTDTLVVDHNAGFFSCCSVKLFDIIQYYNRYKQLPVKIDASKQFYNYKIDPLDLNEDVNNLFFKEAMQQGEVMLPVPPIDFHHDYQFAPYKDLDFNNINAFIKQYFTIGDVVEEFVNKIEQKYDIDYNNTAAVFYRGNDKCTETGIASYNDFFEKCSEIQSQNPSIQFLVQTDELEFKEAFCATFTNSFAVREMPLINRNQGLVMHHVIDKTDRPKFGIRMLGMTYCLSKAKYIVTHSGNCGMWAVLLRGHARGVYQFLRHNDVHVSWITSI